MKAYFACLKSVTVTVEVVVVAVVMLIMADNDRKQLKGGETESGTSSTRQPHASSLFGSFASILRHVHLGQLASERQNLGMSTRLCLLSFSEHQNDQIKEGKIEPTTLTGVNILDKTLDTNVTVPLVLNSPGGPLTSLDPIFRRSRISFNDEFTATY
ncbi:hypothetical protein ANTRET_LOCUS2386 [Anthophora retusa]